jgi:rod shape-determining protein MreC
MRDTRRARLVLALLLLASFTLLTIDYRSNGNSPLRPLERAVGAIVGPGERAVSSAVRPLGDAVHFGDNGTTASRLRRENDALRRQLESTTDDHRRAQELDRLLGYATFFTIKPADVVGWGSDVGFDNTVAIDMGSTDGVQVDMTVVTGLGLVGKVVRVDSDTSTVALVDDPAITVGVRDTRTGGLGSVTGRADGSLDLTIVEQNASIHRGDVVVTLGSRHYVPYVPDVPIGRVVAVGNAPGQLAAHAIVQPFVDLRALDLVGVVFPPPKRAPRNALVPTPTPAAQPTPSPSQSRSQRPHPKRSPSASPSTQPAIGAAGPIRPGAMPYADAASRYLGGA